MDFLTQFDPTGDRLSVNSARKIISAGVERGGFHYSAQAPVGVNYTYALRIIAYRYFDENRKRFSRKNYGKLSPVGRRFRWLNYDKRTDSIFAFQIVRKSVDGGITILWKELSRKKSPVITFEKQDELSDFGN